MVLIKFFMHVSDEEQLERFEKRKGDPVKAWKLTEDDWHNREKRPRYVEALEEMFERTDTEVAPWHVVEAESKKYARVKVVETVIERIERGMRERGIEPPALRAV
jgi:AMP-polyphosphate phosphotransferase